MPVADFVLIGKDLVAMTGIIWPTKLEGLGRGKFAYLFGPKKQKSQSLGPFLRIDTVCPTLPMELIIHGNTMV